MKKVTIILICLIVLLVVLTGGVYAMTTIPARVVPDAKLKVEQGTAQIMKNNTTDWQNVDKEIIVSLGDSIKTLGDSKATINFFDNSRVALDSNTEISIQKLYIDSKNFNKNQVGIKLQVGRIWNRIINLLDKESAYEVSTSSTVATVRGTAFSMAVMPTGEQETDVIDGTVKYYVLDKNLVGNITKDTYIYIDPKTVEQIIPTSITSEKTEDEWFKNNTAQDDAFLKEIQIQKEMDEKQTVGIAPESLLYPIKILAEEVRVAITLDEQKKLNLEGQFINRRLIEAKEMIAAGDTEETNKLLDRYQQGLNDLQAQNPNPETIEQIQQEFINIQKTLDMSADQMKELNAQLQDVKQNAPIELQMINEVKSETIKALEVLPQPTTVQPTSTTNTTTNTVSGQSDTTTSVESTSGGQSSSINSTIQDLENFSQINDTGAALPSTSTTTDSSANNSTTIVEPTTSTSTEPAIISPSYLEISSPRTNMAAGENVQLSAFLVFTDGSKQDVTTLCSWTMSGDAIGTISSSGLLQTVSPGGTATISASYVYEGKNFVASKDITALSINIGNTSDTNW